LAGAMGARHFASQPTHKPLLPVFEDKCHDALSERLAGAMGARHFASQPTHNARAALVFEVPTLPRLVISKLRRVTS
jgi:hypothetical protein